MVKFYCNKNYDSRESAKYVEQWTNKMAAENVISLKAAAIKRINVLMALFVTGDTVAYP